MTKRILIIEVNWLGDVIFSTPFIKAVREAYPDGYIACLIHPRCCEVIEGSPRINDIIIYDEEGAHKGLFGKLRLIREVRAKRFDTTFILHRSFTKALIAFLAGIKERIGYPTKGREWLLTKAVEGADEQVHKVEYFLNIARGAGITPKDNSYEFFTDKSDDIFIERLLAEDGIKSGDKIITLCPGGNWDPKRWPKERFAGLAAKLSEKTGVKIAIAGAAKDVKLAEFIRNQAKIKAAITCGRTNIKQLGALFKRSGLVIANDTGPMHIAVASGSKVIALFGPTAPALTGPYGRGNYKVIFKNNACTVPCYDLTCGENRCMSAIEIEDVVTEAEKLW